MKRIILVLLLFSSTALSKEVDYDLIKSDLDLVSSAIDAVMLKKESAKQENKLGAIQSILKDVDTRLNKVQSSCDSIDRLQLLIKRFNELPSDLEVDLRPYYGNGNCQAVQKDSCVTHSGEIISASILSVEKEAQYFNGAARVCVSLFNDDGLGRRVWLPSDVKEYLEDILSENIEYISSPSVVLRGGYRGISVKGGKDGFSIDLGSHLHSEKIKALYESIGQILKERVFQNGEFFIFELRKIALLVDKSYAYRESKYIQDDVPCDLDYSLEEWNQLEIQNKTFKTIRCHIDGVRNQIFDVYNKLREDDPDLSGDMVIELIVNSRGEVIVQNIDSRLPDALSAVTNSALETIRFPKMSDMDMTIQYTFKFVDDNL